MLKWLRLAFAKLAFDDRPRCITCGRVLNLSEIIYYETTCEKCERIKTRLYNKEK